MKNEEVEDGKKQVTIEDLKHNFDLFLFVVWKYLNLPEPTFVQRLIAQYIANSDEPMRIIQAYRGAGKSYILYAYCVWRIWKNPNINILVVSGTGARAHSFSKTCQRLIDLIPFLNHLKPTDKAITYTATDWTVATAHVSGSNTVKSVGITGSFTGQRADLILADDIETADNANTVEQREKLRKALGEFLAVLKGDEGHGNISEIVFLGTPQSAESIYNDLADTGYHRRIWPIEILTEAEIEEYNGQLCPVIEDYMYENQERSGASVDPKRFTDDDLADRKSKYGMSDYKLQFLLNTNLSDEERYPLKLRDLIIHDAPKHGFPQNITHSVLGTVLDGFALRGFSKDRFYRAGFVDQELARYEDKILAVDPSGRGADATGYAVLKSCMGYVYCPDAGSTEGGYEESALEKLAVIAKENECQRIVVESNFGDGMFNKLLVPIVNRVYRDKSYCGYVGGCAVDEQRASGQKEKRIIDTLEPLMNRHKLIVSTDVLYADAKCKEPKYSLFYQMTHITKDAGCLKHDDALDALEIGVRYLSRSLSRDNTEEIRRNKELAQDELLAKCRIKRKMNTNHQSNLYVRDQNGTGTHANAPTLFDSM